MQASVTTALVVGAVLCLFALHAEGRHTTAPTRRPFTATPSPPSACDCGSRFSGRQHQLIRGANQVALCEAGYYCDCASRETKRCSVVWGRAWRYEERQQQCSWLFDCAKYDFGRRTTTPTAAPTSRPPRPTTRATTTTPTTVAPSPTTTPGMPASCSCGSRATGYQLIRGTDQVALCEAGYYCDCASGETKRCSVVWGRAWRYEEPQQQCSWLFDCKRYNYGTPTSAPATSPRTPRPRPTTSRPATRTAPTAGPSTAVPPTTTPSAPASCNCESNARGYQLLRGANQVALCEAGYYCDCATGETKRCNVVWGRAWRYEEPQQQCSWLFDCKGYDYGAPTSAPVTRPSTPRPRPTTSRPATRTAATGGPSPSSPVPPTTTTPSAPESCSCDSNTRGYQLLRGANQVALCEAGFYCDCAAGETKRCSVVWGRAWRYEEPEQKCSWLFDCKRYNYGTPTSAPVTSPRTPRPRPTTSRPATRTAPTRGPSPSSPVPPPTTTTPGTPASCNCGSKSSGYQLIRGANQVALCEAGYYCDCAAGETKRCSVVWGRAWRYEEPQQQCSWLFDCKGYDYGAPTSAPASSPRTPRPRPTTSRPATRTAPTKGPSPSSPVPPTTTTPSAPESCSCDSNVRGYQLLRGANQVALCEAGYYCDCAAGETKRCSVVWGRAWRYEEPQQQCSWLFDCKKYDYGTPTSAPATSPRTPRPRPTTSRPATRTSPTRGPSPSSPVPPPTTSTPGTPASCNCGSKSSGYQLIRGANQVALCEAGYYCDCAAGETKRCSVVWGRAWRYEEPEQQCSWLFDCKRYNYGAPTSAPATSPRTPRPRPTTTRPATRTSPTRGPSPSSRVPPTTTTPASCNCGSKTSGYQLIRGANQVALCEAGYYCDCASRETQRCSVVWGRAWCYDEVLQQCSWLFDCQGYEYGTPTTAAPASTRLPPSTIAPSPPKPDSFCSSGADFELIRGEDEMERCQRGYYKDCRKGRISHCFNLWGLGWKFNEEDQKCEWMQDCKELLDDRVTRPKQ